MKTNMNELEKKKKKIIIIGSGWAASSFLKHLDADLISKHYEMIVVSPSHLFLYTPLLINSIFTSLSLTLPITELNSFPITYINNKVSDIDFQKNKLFLEKKDGGSLSSNLSYDYLILAHGSVVNTFDIQGIKEHCYFIKEEKDACKIQEQLNLLFESVNNNNNNNDNNNNNNKYSKNIAIIGTSFAGVELIGEFIDRIQKEENKNYQNHHQNHHQNHYIIKNINFMR
jgi:NADH dehydrogenase FAD-containing subunit